MLVTCMRRFVRRLFVGSRHKALNEGLIHAPLRELVKVRPCEVLSRHILNQNGKLPIVVRAPVDETKNAFVAVDMPLKGVLGKLKLSKGPPDRLPKGG